MQCLEATNADSPTHTDSPIPCAFNSWRLGTCTWVPYHYQASAWRNDDMMVDPFEPSAPQLPVLRLLLALAGMIMLVVVWLLLLVSHTPQAELVADVEASPNNTHGDTFR